MGMSSEKKKLLVYGHPVEGEFTQFDQKDCQKVLKATNV